MDFVWLYGQYSYFSQTNHRSYKQQCRSLQSIRSGIHLFAYRPRIHDVYLPAQIIVRVTLK